MTKMYRMVIGLLILTTSLVYAQAGDHFAQGTITSVGTDTITISADGQPLELNCKDFTSYEMDDQQIPRETLSAGTQVHVAYYVFDDEGNVLTHLKVKE